MKQNIPSIMQGAEPYFQPGNDIGCLCLHGLAASPAEVRWLAEFLAAQGLTVCMPRIAGHGTDYRHLRHLRWQDWYMSALDGYHLLRQVCRVVFVVGHSMGGLLALLLGAAEPVDGLVVMASPVQRPESGMMPYAYLIKHVRPYVHLADASQFPARLREAQQQRGEAVVGRVRYDIWASQAIEELYTLMQVVDTQLPGVTAPALLLYSAEDKTVPVSNLDYVRKRIGSTVIETHTYQQSGHILPQDDERDDVFQRTAWFITQHGRE